MSAHRRHGGQRPGMVLPLADHRSPAADPRGPGTPGGTSAGSAGRDGRTRPADTGDVRVAGVRDPRRIIRWAVGVGLTGAVLLGLLSGGSEDTAPGGAAIAGSSGGIDVATEDAVVAVLQLYAAELALADAVAGEVDVFAVPGPLGRADAIQQATAAAAATLEDLRAADVGPGTPAIDYADDPDHDRLLGLARSLSAHARALGVLGAIHDGLYGGAGTSPGPEALATAGSLAGDEDLPAPTRTWAGLLSAPTAGDRVASERLRAEASAAWQEGARRVGHAAGPDLVAFLNGIDPGVLAALDGHPVAGPALRTLR